MTIIDLIHARVHLALHLLRDGEGTPILLLHALGGSAADWSDVHLAWSGPIYALDLCGHGYSGHLRGGAYNPEIWVADADVALAYFGDEALLIGAGVSAYAAALLAGARPDGVRGALLLPGAGLEAAGDQPSDWSRFPAPLTASTEPGALRAQPQLDEGVKFAELLLHPSWYARPIAEHARCLVLSEDNAPRPSWWCALHGLPNVHVDAGGSLASGLTLLAYRTGLPRQLEAMHVRAGSST